MHERVDELLSDLCSFCNDGSLPAVAQAAIAHAQFETIHPFVDGNGRTGRVLLHLVLRRRGLAPRILPPISLVLATWPRDYVGGLSGTRYEGAPDSDQARIGINRWIALFASACRRAAEDAERFEGQVCALQNSWRERLRPTRRGSAADLLVRALPDAPMLTTTTASDLIGRSFQATKPCVRGPPCSSRRSRRWSANSRAPKETPLACVRAARRCAGPATRATRSSRRPRVRLRQRWHQLHMWS